MVKMCYGEPVILPTDASNNFCLQPEVLRQTLLDISTHGGLVACIILCNPHNPTGSVPTRLQLEALAEVLRDYPQVVVISDEIYERLLHDDAEHTSIASLEGMSERTVTVNGPSKAFSMTGFRIGYCVAPLVLAKAMGKLQSQITSCASSVSQYAALAALTVVGKTNPNWLPSRLAELTTQRDLAHKLLVAIPHVHCTKPNGAFYLFPDVSHYFGKRLVGEGGRESVVIGDAHRLCVELLRSQHVALVPGDAFGAPNNVRLCYAADQCTIKEAIGGLKIFLESLR
jgi:aspartate/methionine/tyrosine aminotransferase